MKKIPDDLYNNLEKEANEYVEYLLKGKLKQEVYTFNLTKELVKVAFIAGKVKEETL